MPDEKTVNQVAGDAAKDQAERGLADDRASVEIFAVNKQKQQCDQRHNGEKLVVAAQDAPRRAGVSPVHELEKSVEHHVFVAMKLQRPQHDLLGDLVQKNDCEGEQPDSLIFSA